MIESADTLEGSPQGINGPCRALMNARYRREFVQTSMRALHCRFNVHSNTKAAVFVRLVACEKRQALVQLEVSSKQTKAGQPI